ncbi:MAG: HAMP domain-containing sensor histidine kinase [Patescibacteria group bacterium]
MSSFLFVTLSIGTSVALVLLGFTVWLRHRRVTGAILFALMAFAIAYWTAFLVLTIAAQEPSEFMSLRTYTFLLNFFVLSLPFAPAIAAHAAAIIAHRTCTRSRMYFYGAALIISLIAAMSIFSIEVFSVASLFSPETVAFVLIGCFLLTIFASIVCSAFELFPLLYSHSVSVLDRRRAAYGLILVILFILASGSFVGFYAGVDFSLLPLFALAFLLISLLAFTRASFLDVDMPPVEAFYILLLTCTFLLFLRAGTHEDRTVVVIGASAIGFFGAYAVKTCRRERRRRVDAEADAADARRLDEAKSDFVDMVSHQLRSPLGAIRAASAMLADGDCGALPEKANLAATQIENTATRLLSLAETFLNASRVELGFYESVRVPTDVAEEIRAALAELSPLARAKKITLESYCRTPLPLIVRVDRDALRNVLYNLLDNALKYTARGSVTVTYSLHRGDLAIDVVDTGEGMTQEELAELFKKFHRGNAARRREADGTGLGLYVVRRLVSAAGGAVSADSAGLGKGSVLSVHLPADPT